MGSTFDDRIKIAPGFDQPGSLTPFYLISPPLFSDFRALGGILTNWFNAEEYVRDGNGLLRPRGLPHVELILGPRITIPEMTVLYTYEGQVTARLFNKKTGVWGNYNGIFELGEESGREWESDKWNKVTIAIWQLYTAE